MMQTGAVSSKTSIPLPNESPLEDIERLEELKPTQSSPTIGAPTTKAPVKGTQGQAYLSYFDPKIFMTPPEVLKTLEVHLIFTVHGIGARMDILNSNLLRFGDVVEQVKRARPALFSSMVHLKMLDWKSNLSQATRENIEKATLKNNTWKRALVNSIPSDVIFYLVPEHAEEIKRILIRQANSYYDYAKTLFPNIKVSFIAHSLGSVILYDILRDSMLATEDHRFSFPVEHIVNIGSPLGLFCSIRDKGKVILFDKVGIAKSVYNVFHPQDLVAYRLEPLISDFPELEPFILPYYVNDAYRRHKEKSSVRALFGKSDGPKKKYNEGESDMKRYDFQLQENKIENVFETVGIIKGHFSYWENKDFAYFLLRRLQDMAYAPITKEEIVAKK
eukprot:TRINITY_DN9474_c0_g1_i1.p1 TRINITY_DN9474_c0_g1~~TRINITY_DN9474_c0_g1_i1.p1  ORF type:complete len:389 (-),score=64.82 TRINITY_DN9474_c0_g1_i1:116-1282(-)